MQELLALAAAKPHLIWKKGTSLEKANNAHTTNTFQELAEALQGEYNWLECDVNLEGGLKVLPLLSQHRPICAHSPLQTNGLLFEEWLRVGAASGRGLKIDFKTTSPLKPILALLKKYQVPDHRILFNLSVGITKNIPLQGGLGRQITLFAKKKHLKLIREAFPEAMINLGLLTPGSKVPTSYRKGHTDLLILFAQAVGKPVMFPLRAEYVTPEVISSLQPHGLVAIWNDPATFVPDNVEQLIKKLRSWGVGGMIDLRQQH